MVLRLALGLAAVSSGAVFIRFAQEAPDLAIAFWRLAPAALIFLIVSVVRRRGPRMSTSTRLWSVASGLALALHFVLWIASLRLTSVASSTLLMSTHPLFVSIGATLFLKERPTIRLLFGMGIAIAGGVLIAWVDGHQGSGSGLGNLLAVGGGIMAAVYFVIGRHVRRSVALPKYACVAYGTAACAVLGVCLVTRTPLTGYSHATVAALAALSLFPQVIGHSTFNWALRHLDATRVSILILGEPVGASILAAVLFHERPGWLKVSGAVIILAGVYLSLRSNQEDHHGGSQEPRTIED